MVNDNVLFVISHFHPEQKLFCKKCVKMEDKVERIRQLSFKIISVIIEYMRGRQLEFFNGNHLTYLDTIFNDYEFNPAALNVPGFGVISHISQFIRLFPYEREYNGNGLMQIHALIQNCLGYGGDPSVPFQGLNAFDHLFQSYANEDIDFGIFKMYLKLLCKRHRIVFEMYTGLTPFSVIFIRDDNTHRNEEFELLTSMGYNINEKNLDDTNIISNAIDSNDHIFIREAFSHGMDPNITKRINGNDITMADYALLTDKPGCLDEILLRGGQFTDFSKSRIDDLIKDAIDQSFINMIDIRLHDVISRHDDYYQNNFGYYY